MQSFIIAKITAIVCHKVLMKLEKASNFISKTLKSADEKAAVTFPAELKKINKKVKYDPRQVFKCDEKACFGRKRPRVPTVYSEKCKTGARI